MTSILKYFHPDPHISPITNPEVMAKKYQYWRIRILYAMFIGYALYYFTRGTLAIAMPALKKMGYDETHLGWMITLFQISYGVSKFGNGILADRANPRYFMALGLMLTGVMTILFGITTSLLGFIVLWTLHGWFQGCGSAPCHRLLTHWYSKSERGRWWGIWNTSHNAGAALLPLLGAYLLSYYGWESVMIVPGVIVILGGFFLMNRLRDTPQSLGLPRIEKYRDDDYGKNVAEQPEQELSYREILGKYVLTNKALWILAVTYFMVYVIRWTVSHWAFHFLVDSKQYEVWMAAKCIWWYEIGGFVGGIAAGWVSDVAFRGKRTIVHFLFFIGILASVFAFSHVSATGSHYVLIQLVMGSLGFFIFGPQMLLAVHAAELSHKKAAATAVGFLGIIAYIGSAMTGGPLGYLVKHAGWESVFLMMEICAVVGTVSLLFLWWWTTRERAQAQPTAQ